MALVNRTLATFLKAEFGFLGVVVYTLTQTPRFCGQDFNAGLFVFLTRLLRPFLTSCAIVGTFPPFNSSTGSLYSEKNLTTLPEKVHFVKHFSRSPVKNFSAVVRQYLTSLEGYHYST
jgi:hypothetical protein